MDESREHSDQHKLDTLPEGDIAQHMDNGNLSMPEADILDAPCADLPQRFQAEYRRMLERWLTNDLSVAEQLCPLAQRRGIDVTSKAPEQIIEELAEQLSDVHTVHLEILDLDPVARAILNYMRLVAIPGSGLKADTIVRALAEAYECACWPMQDVLVRMRNQYDSLPASSRRIIYHQILALCQQGFLLPFEQNGVPYYSLPLVVRAALPAQPDLFPAYAEDKVSQLEIHETPAEELVQTLYTVWSVISASSRPVTRASEPHARLYRRATPPRQPIEDRWPALQGWDHVPAEIGEIERQADRGRSQGPSAWSSHYSSPGTSPGPISQSLTVPAPAYRLHQADRELLRERTGHSDPELEFYYALLEQMGALSAEPGQPITVDEEVIYDFLGQPLPAQIRTLAHTWQSHTGWSEMDMVLRSEDSKETEPAADADSQQRLRLRRSLKYASYKALDLYREWRAGRQALLGFLCALEEGRWFSVEGFLRAVFSAHPNLLHTRSDPSVWWLESTKTRKQFGTTFDDWLLSYGRFVLAALEGPLQWLGIISLGYQDGQPVALKLSPLGSFVIGRRSTLPESTWPDAGARQTRPACVLGDDLTITLVPNRAPAEFHKLLRCVSEIEEATPRRFVYRITADGVRRWNEARAAARGRASQKEHVPGVETLIRALDHGCRQAGHQAGLPDAWQERLQAWNRNLGQLHVYEDLTLIELADDYVLQELLATTSLQEVLVYQFSPRLIAIRPEAVDALVQEMEQRGYTPRVESR